MTKSLRCRDVERLVLEREERAFGTGEQSLVEEHLRACARCRAFAAARARIREEFAAVRWLAPPEALVLKTRRLVRDAEREAARPAVPNWVLVALAAVTIITSLWLAAWLPDITPDMTLANLPFGARAAVFIIVQNALMLFCAPVVLRTARARRAGSASAR